MNDVIIIACNTAHLLQPDIERRLNIRITSMVDAAIDYVSRHHKIIRLLASPTTIRTGLYDKPLKAAGVTVLTPDKDEEQALEVIIRAVISGQTISQSALDKIPITIQSEQANAANYPPTLLGCTELSCVFAEKPNTIDPMNILLRYLTTKGVL